MTTVLERPTEMTATEASRHFSDVLDRAKAGETITVTRNGQAVAQITPAPEPKPNGAAFLAFLETWEGGAFDDESEAFIASLREPNDGDRERMEQLESLWHDLD